MRTWIPFLLLGAVVCAQDATEQEKPAAPPAKKDWEIDAPPSNPAGEAIKLGPVFQVGRAHAVDFEMTMKMDAPMPMKMVMGMAMKFKVLSEERGEYGFECPLEFTKMTANGQDWLQMLGAQMTGLKMVGRIDKDGKPVQGSVKIVNLPPAMARMGPQLEGQLGNMLGYWPTQPVRVGQSWEVPIDDMRGAMGMALAGAKLEGKAYQVLEATEQYAGVDCARVKTRMGVHMFGDNVEFQPGVKAKVDMTMKGDVVSWMGLDGYQRGTQATFKVRVKADIAGMGPTEMKMEMAIKASGGPEQIEQETPEEPEEPQSGAADD